MLKGTELRKSFVTRRDLLGRPVERIEVVRSVSLEVRRGETLALVGESGSGKSTTAELMLMLQEVDSGRVEVDGVDVTAADRGDLRRLRRKLQVVFQDPYASLDPTQNVISAMTEPLRVHRLGSASDRRESAKEKLTQVGLPLDDDGLKRYPAEFSGGQRQRLAIARALILEPDYLVLDEAVSALDVSTQAQILELLGHIRDEKALGYLFISHDLGVVRHVADLVAVMYLGEIVELAPAAELYRAPLHPYTAALVGAVPFPNPAIQRARRASLPVGEPPDAANRPDGCSFRARCPHAAPVCSDEAPVLRVVDDRRVACHFAEAMA